MNMEQEYYIIKRVPWEYDQLPDYYAGLVGFTRNLYIIAIFDSMDEAGTVIQNIKKSDPEAKDYTFSIVRM